MMGKRPWFRVFSPLALRWCRRFAVRPENASMRCPPRVPSNFFCRNMFGIGLKSMPRGAEVRLSLGSAIRWPATGRAVLCIALSLDRLPAVADTIDALRGM